MSFIHESVIGHFDPNQPEPYTVHGELRPQRPIDVDWANDLLRDQSEAVRECVWFHQGFVVCRWSAARGQGQHRLAQELAERLADQQEAIVLESCGGCWFVRYPLLAVRQFEAAAGWQVHW